MPNYSEWEVELAVSGPITIRKSHSFPARKGSEHPFWSNVSVKKVSRGLSIKVIARAITQDEANDAGIYFVGQSLDILTLRLNLPVDISLTGLKFEITEENVKRIVENNEWEEAFRLGRIYGMESLHLSSALSWYRKGLVSENPIDKIMAFWSALEGIGAAGARQTDRAQRGSVNKICDCFDQLWGSMPSWKVIPNQPTFINRMQDFRNGIAHGYRGVNIENLREISEILPQARLLTHTFLSDWENNHRIEMP